MIKKSKKINKQIASFIITSVVIVTPVAIQSASYSVQANTAMLPIEASVNIMRYAGPQIPNIKPVMRYAGPQILKEDLPVMRYAGPQNPNVNIPVMRYAGPQNPNVNIPVMRYAGPQDTNIKPMLRYAGPQILKEDLPIMRYAGPQIPNADINIKQQRINESFDAAAKFGLVQLEQGHYIFK